MPLSRAWFGQNLGKHVEAFHLQDDGRVVGHIYWAPSNRALTHYDIEDGVAFVYCEWVQHDYRGEGGMRMLFEEFVDYLHRQNFKGILVEATTIEEYMHYRHFMKRGFRVIRESGTGKLLYYPINRESVWVETLQPHTDRAGTAPIDLLVVGSHSCPVAASTVLALRKVAAEFCNDMVTLREVPADSGSMQRFGIADGIYLNGRPSFIGPVDEEIVREAIRKELTVTMTPHKAS